MKPDSHASRPLSTIGRLRLVLMARLVELGHEVVEEHPDHIVVNIHDQPHSIYLNNLSRALEFGSHIRPGRATQPSDEQLQELLDEWLTVHLRQLPSRQSLEESFRTLEAVGPMLLPRVVAPVSANQPGQRWSRPLCDEFLELALVIDQPDIVTFATPEMVAGWDEGAAEAIAMANLRKMVIAADFGIIGQGGPDEQPDELGEQGQHGPRGQRGQPRRLRMCATTDSYASSRSLLAEEFLSADSRFGILATLPSRDLLFAEPLGRHSLQDLVYLALLARKSVAELPYPLSGEVFWVRHHRWQQIPIRIGDGQMDVDSSGEFAAVLQELLAEEQ